ncbi:DUF3300 domain-containing protein [Paraburkholderia sp. RG36]|uniref:DUF3300 domain-containing protein n=2 Tax=Paraburkholderia tagetis TaxID=2913261 RepID=A0A9X2A0V0_9BURK|nr:DUF3300 domain-containing protein [Paraburkholderia tagetis]MCG5077541.1 DUF3300 domain-containing protein [Paraburkholderia tagetis]
MCAALAAAPLFVGPTGPAAAIAQSAAHLSNQQLDSLTAPIALYPDALLAQVLMAATFPQDVQAAAAWSKANPNLKGDDAVKAVASQPWDPSVQSLVAFPQVLATMDSKPDWVSQIGNAFLAQPGDVMDSVQRLRAQAQKAGNLKTTEQQKVIVQPATSTSTTQTIVIEPANPQVVYVPTYNPTVVYGAWPYPAYPPVYMPPPPGYAIATGFVSGLAFGAGIAVANSLWGGFGWGSHDVNINVNRYNNINVNNRINTNHSTTNWNRNANVERRNQNFNGQHLNNANLNGQHNSFRGYDQSRSQAMQTLQNRTGQNLGGNASERLHDIQQGGNRPNANGLQNGNRGNGPNDRAQNLNHGNELNNRGQNLNRPNDLGNRAQSANRDNALRGAGDGNAARADMQRGQQSRAAFQNRGGGGFGGGGFGGAGGDAHPSFGGGGGGRLGGGGHFGRR